MKKFFFLLLGATLLFHAGLFAQGNSANVDYTKFVNVFTGTGALDTNSLSGSNFPGACTPFGLVQLSPDTREYPDNQRSGNDYKDSTILGFSHTHLMERAVPTCKISCLCHMVATMARQRVSAPIFAIVQLTGNTIKLSLFSVAVINL